jgi:hypothetical protein
MTTERAIVKAILAYLNDLPGCLARKRWGGGMGVAGDPDIDACIRGRSVQLEVKRPGEKPTPLQLKRLEEWRRAGAVVAVVNSVADVRRLLQENRLLDRTTEAALANIVSEKSFVR